MSFDTTRQCSKASSSAKYMANFIEKPQQERHSIISEWQHYTTTTTTNSNPSCFFIPFVADNDEDEEDDKEEQTDDDDGDDNKPPLHALKQWMVCKDAITVLLDYGKFKWRTCQKAVKNNRPPEHGNEGKVTGKAKHFANEVKDDLHEFFHQLNQFLVRRLRDWCERRLERGCEMQKWMSLSSLLLGANERCTLGFAMKGMT